MLTLLLVLAPLGAYGSSPPSPGAALLVAFNVSLLLLAVSWPLTHGTLLLLAGRPGLARRPLAVCTALLTLALAAAVMNPVAAIILPFPLAVLIAARRLGWRRPGALVDGAE